MAITSLLPNRYKKSDREYIVPLPLGLPISMFLNTEAIDYANFVDLELAGVDSSGQIIYPNVGTLQKVQEVDDPSKYKLYFENLILSGGTLHREFYFIVFDNVTQEVLFKSNCFITKPTEAADTLARLSYRHSSNIYGYNFTGIPSFRQVLYVDLNATHETPEYDVDNYTESTTGYIRPKESEQKLRVTFTSGRFDLRAHLAMMGLSACDDVEINFRPYQTAEGYTYSENRRTSRQEGTIEMYDQDVNMIQLNGLQSV